jgi:hypothetical protein
MRASATHNPHLLGVLKDSGLSVSEEDIAEARKEMWGNFPRERFFDADKIVDNTAAVRK